MNGRVMSPAPQAVPGAPYEYQTWPAWFYGPGDKKDIFECAEDVPDGWVTYDQFLAGELEEAEATGVTGEDKDRVLTTDQRKAALGKLVDNNTQAELADMLTTMKAVDDSIEFLATWPKAKLAETILDNGGPLDAEQE